MVALLCLGCSGPEEWLPPEYSGELGKWHAVTMSGWTPRVTFTLAGGAASAFVLDTGAALTVRHGPNIAPGRGPLSFTTFGLKVSDFPVATWNLFPYKSPCEAGLPGGVLGGDFLGWFRLQIDYPAKRASLSTKVAAAPASQDVLATVTLNMAGEGAVTLPGGAGEADLPRVWPIVPGVEVEGTAVNALLDTGASFSLVDPMLIKALDASATARPAACCQSLHMAGGQKSAVLTRIKRLKVGAVEVTSHAAAVLDSGAFWSELSAAAGRKVQLIIGGTLLRRYRVSLDYPARKLQLVKPSAPFVANPDEFLLPGFTFCRAAGQDAMVVLDVFQRFDAANLGVSTGDLFTHVGGKEVGKRTEAQVLEQLRAVKTGQRVDVKFKDGGTRKVKMEQLLKEYN